MFKFIFTYVILLGVWLFSVLIPYTKNVFYHVQDVVNNNVQLDLIYCGKQILIGLGWTFLLLVIYWIVNYFIFKFTYDKHY